MKETTAMRSNRRSKRTMRSALAPLTLAVALAAAGGGCDSDRPPPFDSDGDTDSDGGDGSGTGGFGFPGGPNGQGPMGNPQYQPNFLQRGRPPGPPRRGYTAVEAALAGTGEGALCAVCADSSDCALGACVIHMDTGETFCGAECWTDLDCPDPWAQECVDVADATAKQCVPRIGSCYEFEPGAEPLNPINEPPADLDPGEGGAAGSSGSN